MSSNRPYLLRAIYDWICDNDLTPYVMIDAMREGVKVPSHVIKNGQVVLNLAMRAVANLDLGNEWISFQARFSGVSHNIHIPIQAVQAIYAQENGQGMMFASEEDAAHAETASAVKENTAEHKPPENPSGKEKRSGPHLRVVK